MPTPVPLDEVFRRQLDLQVQQFQLTAALAFLGVGVLLIIAIRR